MVLTSNQDLIYFPFIDCRVRCSVLEKGKHLRKGQWPISVQVNHHHLANRLQSVLRHVPSMVICLASALGWNYMQVCKGGEQDFRALLSWFLSCCIPHYSRGTIVIDTEKGVSSSSFSCNLPWRVLQPLRWAVSPQAWSCSPPQNLESECQAGNTPSLWSRVALTEGRRQLVAFYHPTHWCCPIQMKRQLNEKFYRV